VNERDGVGCDVVAISQPLPKRRPVIAALLLVAVIATGLGTLLLADGQMAVASVLAAFVAFAFLTQRTSMGRDLVEAAGSSPATLDAAAVVAAAALLLFFRADDYVLLMIATVAFFATACLGLTLQMAFAGIANFAAGAFFAVGSYTAALLMTHTAIPDLAVLALAGAAAGIAGLVVLLPVLRTRGHYVALVTIGFAVLLRTFLEVNDVLGGTQGLKIRSFTILGLAFNDLHELAGSDVSFYLAYALMALLMLGVAKVFIRRVENSWLGVVFDIVRSDELAASVFGIATARWKALAFVLGNVLIGIAGAGYGVMNGFVNPSSASLQQSLLMISVVVLGGIGSFWGVVAGATIILVVPEKLQAIQEYRLALFSALVLVVLLFRPSGILPRRMRVLSRFASKGARHA
jgi:ABC-type branched-subunit amino acid transport system permease subunit